MQKTYSPLYYQLVRETREINETKKTPNEDEKLNMFSINYPFQGNPFDGIISKYIDNNKTGELVRITSSPPPQRIPVEQNEKLIDFTWRGVWISSVTPPNWIKYEFLSIKVYVTHYSIKSGPSPKNGPHLMNWKLEGSLDNKKWFLIDERKDDELLNDNSAISTYECAFPHKCRYIMLTMIGSNHAKNGMLQLTNIEFFGGIKQINIYPE